MSIVWRYRNVSVWEKMSIRSFKERTSSASKTSKGNFFKLVVFWPELEIVVFYHYLRLTCSTKGSNFELQMTIFAQNLILPIFDRNLPFMIKPIVVHQNFKFYMLRFFHEISKDHFVRTRKCFEHQREYRMYASVYSCVLEVSREWIRVKKFEKIIDAKMEHLLRTCELPRAPRQIQIYLE